MDTKKSVINRLKRAEGQLRGVQKMIEEDQECIDIVNQLSAVRSSINRIMGVVIAEKVRACIDDPGMDAEHLEEAIDLIIRK